MAKKNLSSVIHSPSVSFFLSIIILSIKGSIKHKYFINLISATIAYEPKMYYKLAKLLKKTFKLLSDLAGSSYHLQIESLLRQIRNLPGNVISQVQLYGNYFRRLSYKFVIYEFYAWYLR